MRPLLEDVYERILRLTGVVPTGNGTGTPLPDLSAVTLVETDEQLLVPRNPTLGIRGPETAATRYSRNAAAVGGRAEELVHQFLLQNAGCLGAKKIRWIAREGGTPGWDLQYENQRGELIAVEVKGCTGPHFGSIDITAGEWRAAVALGDRY